MDVNQLMESVKKQEELLQFDHFNNEDALNLGMIIVERAKKENLSIVVDIRVGGFQMFRYSFAGTSPNNDSWLFKKANTVHDTGKSSLRIYCQLEQRGGKLGNIFIEPQNYANCGGGFPILLKNTGPIGVILVSGLDHISDHMVIVDALCNYLNIEL